VRYAPVVIARNLRQPLHYAFEHSTFAFARTAPHRIIRLYSLLFGKFLDDLRCERNNLHEALIAKLAGDGTKYASPDRLTNIINQHRGI
jgi:hypothetical protein